MNFSDWPAWIALIVAIISPVATAILTNRHQYKMQKLKYEYEENRIDMEKRQQAYLTFLTQLSSISTMQRDKFRGVPEDVYHVLIYCNDETKQAILKLVGQLDIDQLKSSLPDPEESISHMNCYVFRNKETGAYRSTTFTKTILELSEMVYRQLFPEKPKEKSEKKKRKQAKLVK